MVYRYPILLLFLLSFSASLNASYVDEAMEALDIQMHQMRLGHPVGKKDENPSAKKHAPFDQQNLWHFQEEIKAFQQRAEEEIIHVVKMLIQRIESDVPFFENRHQIVVNKMRERIDEWMKEKILTIEHYDSDHHYSSSDCDNDECVSESDDSDEDGWRIAYKRGFDYSSGDSDEENQSYDDYGDNDYDDYLEESSDDHYEDWKRQKIFDYLGLDLASSDDLTEEVVDEEAIRRFLSNHVARGYSWLINEDVEGSLSTSEDFVDKHYQTMRLDKDILGSVLCALWFDFDWEEHDFFDSKYIQKTYVSTLMKLVKGEVSFDLKEKLTERISRLFTFHGEDFDEPFKAIPDRFNHFVEKRNWLAAMIEWSIYATYRKTFSVPPVGGVSHPLFHQLNRKSILQKKMTGAHDRAKKAYTKVYPHPRTNRVVYGKKQETRAEMNFAVELKKLKEIGQRYESKRPSKASAANIFVPQLYVIVSKTPVTDVDQREEKQFMPVSLVLKEGDKRAVNRTNTDVVYKGQRARDAFYYREAKNHIVKGQKIQEKTDEDAAAFAEKVITQEGDIVSAKKGQAQRIIHSERVFVEALSDAQYIQNMVVRFQEQLLESSGPGHYQVYGGLMLGYSTNTVCEYCTPTLIALQNATEKSGFLGLFVRSLLGAQGGVQFKVHGFNPEKRTMNWSKFRLNTIVTAKINFDCEAHDLADAGQHSHGHVSKPPKDTHNPKAKLFFEDDAINIKPSSKEGSPKSISYFFEFVGPDLHADPMIKENSTIPFNGAVFSSGSVDIRL
ncbi:MAG: hypothetical protein ACTHJ4_04510 [Candidatus Nucleicultricaceae bacterium]